MARESLVGLLGSSCREQVTAGEAEEGLARAPAQLIHWQARGQPVASRPRCAICQASLHQRGEAESAPGPLVRVPLR
jgi:hypothetical protein